MNLSTANPTFIYAFLAGLLSFASPCTLPLYPSYLSYLTGVSYEQMHTQKDLRLMKRNVLSHSLFFVLGFSIIFFIFGLSAIGLGHLFDEYRTLIRQVGGILIILMGLFMAGILRIDLLMKQKKWQLKARPVGYVGAMLVGFSFAAGWTPCIGPILASVLLIAATNPVSGMSLILFYCIGFAVPFLILAYTLGSVRWLLRYTEVISKIGGVGMVVMGVLLLINMMTLLTQWLSDLFGGFTGFGL